MDEISFGIRRTNKTNYNTVDMSKNIDINLYSTKLYHCHGFADTTIVRNSAQHDTVNIGSLEKKKQSIKNKALYILYFCSVFFDNFYLALLLREKTGFIK